MQEAKQKYNIRGVVVDCPTRWNSTYDISDTALELKEAFCRLAELDHDYKNLSSDEEWEMGTWLDNEYEYVCSMTNRMKQNFDKYWDECSLVLAIAVVPDPRFKMEIVTYYYNLIYGEIVERHVTRVREAVNDLYSEYAGFDIEDMSLIDSSVAFQPLRIHGVVDFLRGFDQWLTEEHPECNLGTQNSELDLYLEEKLFPTGEEHDILRFWRVDGLKFPKLSRWARDILAIPNWILKLPLPLLYVWLLQLTLTEHDIGAYAMHLVWTFLLHSLIHLYETLKTAANTHRMLGLQKSHLSKLSGYI
ncbi:PREDICTED: zinc finger BED domain-containing protein RICESLEEPER 3-like [Nelumbo nucifera]|uniref:Zinc finger BED domain-containing protein RICESLEEPER 3-like n=1 Tax=Nelumbo nucifera TaxID=4432 RepID=A0A1U8B1N1_NELNU|nr:PREDICTED: zinc finger BED domain-containing protein RICESLEEPER 3-like [Nelumbo nucifera]